MLLPALTAFALLAVGEPFTLKTGDRVVFLGGGFIEQERQYGYLETRLTSRFPEAEVRFRNLGWGGDTVKGIARTGGYQNPDGFARLLKEVLEEKPTVLILGYGMNESFEGLRGLPAFLKDYSDLLDKLAPLEARIVLVSPIPHENLGRQYPDPEQHNRDLERFVSGIRELTAKRKLAFVDLFNSSLRKSPGLTINGVLLNAKGYDVASRLFADQLGFAPDEWTVLFDKADVKPKVVPAPGDFLRVKAVGLAKGKHRLVIDGENTLAATAEEFAAGLTVRTATPSDSAWERLRKAIVHKNELWYRRWRPFNDHSRHWGYMKGDYALYDKEIAEAEQTIAKLRRPTQQRWEIIRVEDAK